ncbi:MAG: GNAT family N-acetyltransferase [Chloroflexi bacterium]|nr:GNAT family N-acetyltransferase [Chloroflexota bacterium]
MAISIRTITEDDLEAFSRQMSVGFGFDYSPDSLPGVRAILEFDRSISAFDGDDIVSTAGAFTYRMATPGGEVPTAGVTMVTVKATHRRKGILTEMMCRQLADVRDRGEPIATLWASEAPIYGRFGYGLAADCVGMRVERPYAALAHGPASPGTVRLLTPAEARVALPPLWEAYRKGRPGMMTRTPGWWESRVFADLDWQRAGKTANHYALYEEDGVAHGYARYRLKMELDDYRVPLSTLTVFELFGLTPAAEAGLWRFVFGVDLIRTFEAKIRPTDDPLPWMLGDQRRVARTPSDSLWLRVVDVPAALEARRYGGEGRVVLDVHDAFCQWAGGRFALEAGPAGARCKPTTEDADVALGVHDLGAIYLGGVHPNVLRCAGRLAGGEREVALLGSMFASPVAPWCPEIF